MSTLKPEEIDTLWIHRPSIHDGQLMPQLYDLAAAIEAELRKRWFGQQAIYAWSMQDGVSKPLYAAPQDQEQP